MKKILLFIILLFLGFSYGYSQYVPIQIVTKYNDPFLRYLPLNQMVYCKDSDAVYMLDIPAFPISKLSTTANHRVIGFTLDTTGFVMWTDTLVLIATKYDLDTLSNSVYDSLSNHYDLIHGLDTGKVSTSGDVMYGDLIVNADVYVDTLHYDALLPAIPSYWSRTLATGMLKPSTATDWLNIRDSTYIGIPPSAYPSGYYNKLIWLPSKGSLLAGSSSTTYANIGIRSINLGNLNTSSGAGSTTLGSENTASGWYSLSFGHQNSATADNSIAFGEGNSATAAYSISIGRRNSATATWGAVAIGYDNTASGEGSWALGSANTSSALGSYCIGYTTTGTGQFSFRANQYTTAQSYNSSVFGRYNYIDGTTNSWVETDALFVIGNGSGTGANSHNALNLKKNGRIEIRNRTEGLNINERFVQEYNKKLHDGVNDTLYSIIVNSDSAMTAVLNFGYICNNGTERQCRSGVYNIACSIKTGSIVGYQFTSSTSVEHLTSGTLLEGLFLSYNKTTKTIYVIINYDSSLNPSSAQARMNFTINNITGVSTTITNYNYNY